MPPFEKKYIILFGGALFFITALVGIALFRGGSPASVPLKTANAPLLAPPPQPRIPPPALNAAAYIVRFAGDERPLAGKEIHTPLPPASLTKLMTAILTREALRPNDAISFSVDDKHIPEKTTSAPAGEAFGRDDMLRFALISSANDAAMAAAEAVGRKLGAHIFTDALSLFANRMNEKATEIGLHNSHFENPTGLDEDHHAMSAADLARVAEYIWQEYPSLFEISRTPETAAYSLAGKRYLIQNTNELLAEFPAILGSKTGMTDRAKGTLVLLYPVRPDRTAIIAILGSDDRFGDGRKLLHWLDEAF